MPKVHGSLNTYVNRAARPWADNLACVELEAGHRRSVGQRVKYGACAQVPDADRLVQTAADEVHLVKLQTGDGCVMARQGAVCLARSH